MSSNPYPADIYVDDIYCDGTNDHVYDLLAGPHSVGIIKDGYNYAENTVDVVSNQTTYVHFNLTDESGTVQVMSPPTEARVYVDNDYRGMTSSTGGLVLPTVPIGEHQITVTKDGYAPYIDNVTVEKNQTVSVTATLNNDDEEGDGLLDDYEENGFRDGFGNHHTTDPTLIDTDGDGLDDWDEDYLETDPFNPDTDGDFISDGNDDAPLTPAYITVPVNWLIEKRDATTGAIFGETGIKGGSMNWLVGDEVASSPAYFIGWMASGYYVVGDIRDTVEALYQGDSVGAGLNTLGIVPFIGDSERSVNALKKVVTRYSDRAANLGRYLTKQNIIQSIPSESLQLYVLDHCFDGGATALRNIDVPMTRILEVGKIDGIHLARHAEALGIVQGSSQLVKSEGDIAEIIAEKTILNDLYPNSMYTFYSNVELRNVNNMVLGEIDTVIVRDNAVKAIVQTKMGRNAAKHAKDQLSRDMAVINDQERFISTSIPDLLSTAQFRMAELETVAIGPKDGNGFDHVLDYTNRELHELYKTIGV
ncbi:PEGA domain-containing protein [Methanogenium sp. S4BF]|uniref:PEGA domain-containing protein n=1 Tax=Methanogenium sp. S4BF TaxID=1789226 RepID=UPI0024167313|nr:PEGA domain-containing protein [Methanogenium sp. S4BF]WFN34579.1 PEGA domain-containing protein [Methanogenium sp. S4BF]